MITSVGAKIGGKDYDNGFHVTTPDAWTLQKYLRQARTAGVTHVALEVSSHSLDQHRVVCTVIGRPYSWLRKQVEFYCSELERQGKYTLFIWPFHCLLGSPGHALAGVIHEARLFFSFVRGAQSWQEVKGGHPLTENYSVFKPEVTASFDGTHTFGQRNTNLIKTLAASDVVIAAGQAASHCVKSSIDDFLDEIKAQDPELLKKVYILRDCMSSVVTPVYDYTPDAEAALKRFEAEGMHVVDSTTPMADWPSIDSRISA
jgi:nicotinamidase-related amidase